MQSDSGSKFCSKAFDTYGKAHSIAHEATISYTQQLDGKVEVAKWIIIGGTNAMILDTGGMLKYL